MSISYELAKQLKDAGFPQDDGIFVFLSNGEKHYKTFDSKYIPDELEKIKIPTLSELIEACHPSSFDDFGLSTGYTDQWEAWATYHGHALMEVDMKVRGDTPEEAVAKLWIELNKK